MHFLKRWPREVVIVFLLISNMVVWTVLVARSSGNVLSVYFINIGQGDAILIDSPEHNRMLIDGGRNRLILSELGRILPFGDKDIDLVLATHPDADHIGGLPEVVSRYDVGLFLEPGVASENSIDDELKRRVNEKNIPKLLARRGMVINFGDGAKLQILFPNQDVSNWETNRASIVTKLVYGDKSFLLTGDSPIAIENVLINLDSELLDSDVLKAGHHGSRTSSSLPFIKAISPEYAIISAGKNNSYGHPHIETLKILNQNHVQILSTIDRGTIKFETDGESLKLK